MRKFGHSQPYLHSEQHSLISFVARRAVIISMRSATWRAWRSEGRVAIHTRSRRCPSRSPKGKHAGLARRTPLFPWWVSHAVPSFGDPSQTTPGSHQRIEPASSSHTTSCWSPAALMVEVGCTVSGRLSGNCTTLYTRVCVYMDTGCPPPTCNVLGQ